MKAFLKSLKRQDGFTLVELMVVVAIIGLLSAVAVPNFKKYQAKAKISEAKLQLSAIYTAEVAFFSDFGMYATCLRYMGYDPELEISNRYYAMGFFLTPAAARDATASTSAVNSGLLLTSCPDAGTALVGTTLTDQAATYFLAGKGAGSALATLGIATANAVGTAGACATNPAVGPGICLGDQATTASQVFIAGAVGIISADAVTGVLASGLTIDNNKKITTLVTGF